MTYLVVRHNIEVAHRLFELEGDKCQQIHGHSCWVEMKLHGHVNSKGILEGLSFGEIKKAFRTHLDTNFDHHLLLNEKDPWAGRLFREVPQEWVEADTGLGPRTAYGVDTNTNGYLPGLQTVPGDPSTENIARWIANWAVDTFHLPVDVHVQETHVNGAGWSARPMNGDK